MPFATCARCLRISGRWCSTPAATRTPSVPRSVEFLPMFYAPNPTRRRGKGLVFQLQWCAQANIAGRGTHLDFECAGIGDPVLLFRAPVSECGAIKRELNSL